MFDVKLAREKMQKTVDSLSDELKQIRAGRATPAIIEGIMVDVYGSKMPINQLANINVVDANLLTVQSWDKNNVEEIAKAIQEGNVGLSPVIDGELIRLSIPKLSEERREELVKSLGQIIESARIGIRQVRRELVDEVEDSKENKEITEDDEKRMKDQIQNLVDEYNKNIDEIYEKKSEELMTV